MHTLELLRKRMQERSRPGRRDDPHKLGLVIEGGGMRGVVVGGMVTGLEQLDGRFAFDAVYGTSAGAFAGTYFAAGQAALGNSIYLEDLSTREFINPWRGFSGRPVMSLDFLVNRVMTERKRIDFSELIKSGIALNLVATDCDSGNEKVFSEFEDEENLRNVLRASSCMPIIGGLFVDVSGGRYVDGGLLHQIPYRVAAQDGCTHVVVLLPRARTWTTSQRSRAEQLASGVYRAMGMPGAARALLQRRRTIYRDVNYLFENSHIETTENKIELCTIHLPDGTEKISRLERDERVLLEGAKIGAQTVVEAVDGEKHRPIASVRTLRVRDGVCQEGGVERAEVEQKSGKGATTAE